VSTPLHVKICGIRSLAEAHAALEAGADALGFLVGLDYPSDDALEPEAARAIAVRLPPLVRRVLVTHRTNAAEVVALFLASACDTLQLHGDFPGARAPELRAALPGVRIARVVHVDGEAALRRAQEAAAWADALHLDTRTGARLGGTGVTHDWSLSARIVAAAPTPVMLAGGLTPDNVAEAVGRVRPFGVDVNSGVEDARGAKDRALLRAFVAAARAAAL
jgi:phosphoribosylanthranilate isomerase